MGEYERTYNVSVRLKEVDYKKLLTLQEKMNRTSYNKVSLADVLRNALKNYYIEEIETSPFKESSAGNREVKDVTELEKKYSLEEVSEEEIEEDYARSLADSNEKILKPSTAAAHKNDFKEVKKSNVSSIVQSSLEEEKKRQEREAKLKEGLKPAEEILKRSKANK
jgi:hypothetical protein